MIGSLFNLARPLIHKMDAETAHRLTVAALAAAPSLRPAPDDPVLATEAFGLSFSNPVGLAAGFDKHAEAVDGALGLGFGFVEVGGVTPLPQPGNPKPRVFRLVEDAAVINRYGLNSDGMEVVAQRLAARRARGGIVGVNLGANKESADRAADYAILTRRLAPLTDFVTVNVSSPNTPGLRDLQAEAALDDLIARALEARDEAAAGGRPTPMLPEDRAGPDPTGTRRYDRRCTAPRDRRADRLQHHDRPAREPAQPVEGGDRRPLGQAALRGLDAPACRGLPAGRTPVPARRRRRHRFGRNRLRQDPRGGRSRAVLFRHGLPGAWAGEDGQGRARHWRRAARDCRSSPPSSVAMPPRSPRARACRPRWALLPAAASCRRL